MIMPARELRRKCAAQAAVAASRIISPSRRARVARARARGSHRPRTVTAHTAAARAFTAGLLEPQQPRCAEHHPRSSTRGCASQEPYSQQSGCLRTSALTSAQLPQPSCNAQSEHHHPSVPRLLQPARHVPYADARIDAHTHYIPRARGQVRGRVAIGTKQ